MKNKTLLIINKILISILALFGVGSCVDHPDLYAPPRNDYFYFEGQVFDQQTGMPVDSIEVRLTKGNDAKIDTTEVGGVFNFGRTPIEFQSGSVVQLRDVKQSREDKYPETTYDIDDVKRGVIYLNKEETNTEDDETDTQENFDME